MASPRLPFQTLSPAAYQGLVATSNALADSALGPLVELVYLRVSQLNGCAYCLALHTKALRAAGLAQGKLDALAGWWVSEHFDARERAALAWAESLTEGCRRGAPDELYAQAQSVFDEREIADLTYAVALMNAFNRLAVGMRL